MKGIILAGGAGTRLYPLTASVSKQLLPVYNKPMIFYPISTLMLAGIREILVITTPRDLSLYKDLLGDGDKFGVEFQYAVQSQPNGIAEAFLIGRKFLNGSPACLILGDNIFWGQGITSLLRTAVDNESGATVFGYRVKDPSRFGIVEFDSLGVPCSIAEKPLHPRSNIAVTGLYFFDHKAVDIVQEIQPSERCELEITDVLKKYLLQGSLKVMELGRGYAWLDAGTHESLLEASTFVETIEKRQGYKIACLEEIGLNNGWLTQETILENSYLYNKNEYGNYVLGLCKV